MVTTSLELRYGSLSVAIAPGHAAVLGRGSPDRPADLRVADSLDLSRTAAAVHHDEAGRWSVEAASSKNGVVVRHVSGSVIQIPPGSRLEMPEWFTQAYVVITTPSAEYEVSVGVTDRAHDQPGDSGRRRVVSDQSTHIVLPRDPNRADYRTALLLCEPMLEDPFNRRVPTEGEIAQRLNRLGLEEPEIGARTVERRLARLRERFEVASNVELRDRLVSAGLVTRADLDRIRTGAS